VLLTVTKIALNNHGQGTYCNVKSWSRLQAAPGADHKVRKREMQEERKLGWPKGPWKKK